MKRKGGSPRITRSMARKMAEEQKQQPEEKKKSSSSVSASSSIDSNEAGPSNRPPKAASKKKTGKKKPSSDEASPSNRDAKPEAKGKNQVDERARIIKQIKGIENQFKAAMVGLLADKRDAIKENAQMRLQLIDRQLEVLKVIKNKVDDDIDEHRATVEELQQAWQLWLAQKKALKNEMADRLDEEEARIKEIKKEANAEKYQINKLKKILTNELVSLKARRRNIYWLNVRGKEHLDDLIKTLENLKESAKNTLESVQEAVDNWFAIKEIKENDEEQRKEQERIADEAAQAERERQQAIQAAAFRARQEEAARQQAAWQAQMARQQVALQDIDQRAERERIQEEEARRQEQERKDIREGKKTILEKRLESVSRLSKTEKSVLKTSRAFEQLKQYENKMKAIPENDVEYVRNVLIMFKRFVLLGRQLLERNRNPTLQEILNATGFHLHRDGSNTATLKENLNYAEKVTGDIEKAVAKDPLYFSRIRRVDPLKFYCIDGKIDSVSRVIYGEHIWQADKEETENDLAGNIGRVIEYYITPYCNDIQLLYNLKKPDNIQKAIELYENIHIDKVKEYVLNYPEVKKLCKIKAKCDVIHKILREYLIEDETILNITQENNTQYVSCSEDIPTLEKLKTIKSK